MRKGPNKVSIFGFFQPIRDAVKLFCKQRFNLLVGRRILYKLSPIILIFLRIFIWIILVNQEIYFNINNRVLLLLLILRVLIFPIILRGWSSNNKYSFLGRIRAVAQVISYEVVLILILFFLLLITISSNRVEFINFNKYYIIIFIWPFFLFLWVFCVLAETNRIPFDFAEAESELVSGYNTEFIGGFFAIIFISEYSSILFFCYSVYWFFFFNINFLFLGFIIISIFFFIIFRRTFPRYRFDKLILVCWKSLIIIIIILISSQILFFF